MTAHRGGEAPSLTMEDGGQHRHKLRELDGLRGLAALLVVVTHLVDQPPTWLTRFNFGECGVMVFFVLSGFLMGHLYLRTPWTREHVRAFAIARIARIVPIYYLVVVVAYFATPYLSDVYAYRFDTRQLLRLLTFNGSRAVFWSVGPEFQFYAFFVLLWGIGALQGRRRRLALAALGAFALLAYAAAPFSPGVVFTSKLHIFLSGVAIALWRPQVAQAIAARPIARGALQLLAIACIVLLCFPHRRMFLPLFPWSWVEARYAWYYLDLARPLMAALVVFAFTFSTAASRVAFANPFARHLGMISFSLYLLHLPVVDTFRALHLFDAWGRLPASVVCIVVAIAVSTASNRLIETPARAAINARWNRRSPRATTGPQSA